MITRTYITKFNTIIEGSNLNTGLNPIGELFYGKDKSRLLIYFNHEHLTEKVKDHTFNDITKLKHYLKITNAGSLDFRQIHDKEYSSVSDALKVRASSFDLMFFELNADWDKGKGFDYSKTYYNQGYYSLNARKSLINNQRYYSTDGANWYQSQNNIKWDYEGVYSSEYLENEYNKYIEGEESIIIGVQHFDVGNENINLDITNIVNSYIQGEKRNHGIGIAFIPLYENIKDNIDNYVGFLTNNTNTFFAPYVETHYEDVLIDNRSNFVIGRDNRLYLYANIGGKLENLDELPICNIYDDNEDLILTTQSKQYSKGIYYAEIDTDLSDFKPNTMLFDTWDNIIYNGKKQPLIELDFTLKSPLNHFIIGKDIVSVEKMSPFVYGISYDEKIKRGDIRKITLKSRVQYQKNDYYLYDNVEWRLYIKDGTREIDIFPYEKVNKSFLEYFMLIDTNILLPQKYYIDIKYQYNLGEEIMHHDVLSFYVTDNLDNRYL